MRQVKGSNYSRNGKIVSIPDHQRRGNEMKKGSASQSGSRQVALHGKLRSLSGNGSSGVSLKERQNTVWEIQSGISFPDYVIPTDRDEIDRCASTYLEAEDAEAQDVLVEQLDRLVTEASWRAQEYRKTSLFARECEQQLFSPATEDGRNAKNIVEEALYNYREISSEEMDFVTHAIDEELHCGKKKESVEAACASLQRMTEPTEMLRQVVSSGEDTLKDSQALSHLRKNLEEMIVSIRSASDYIWGSYDLSVELKEPAATALHETIQAEDQLRGFHHRFSNGCSVSEHEIADLLLQLETCLRSVDYLAGVIASER